VISTIASIANIASMRYSDAMSVATREPITLPATEQGQVRDLERMLDLGAPALVSASGERLVVPPTVYEILRKVVELMAEGQSVTLLPDNQVVTTQRAADLLGMSRPFFIKLLETGAMAHHRVGNQRRVYLRDVLEFARKRDEERQAALDRLSRQAFEAGLYDRNVMPEGGSDE
jgi:excisionase family DNA binding protein